MLSWSAHETGRTVDLRSLVDPAVDPGLPAGRALIALARAAVDRTTDRRPVAAVASAIGPAAATDAAAVAANFQIMNRVVDATGVPIGRQRRADNADVIAELGLDAFPHAGH